MKTHAKLWIMVVSLAVIFVACGGGGGGSTNDPSPNPNTNINTNTAAPNYAPHTLGSTWTYASVSSGLTTTYTNVVSQSTGTEFTITETYQSFQNYSSHSYALSGDAWKHTKDWHCDGPGNVTDYTAYNAPFPILPSNTAAGTHETYTATWLSNNGNSGTLTADYTVNGFESVTVPAGTFENALKITVTYTAIFGSNTTTGAHTAWYADGVGNVKWVNNADGTTDELVSYTIATEAMQQDPNWPVINATSINSPTTWTSGNVYVIDGYTGISVNAALTIEPGTVIKFKSGKEITVNAGGTIIANGTAEKPIIFTSIKDDAFGGDSNGDGTATAPAVKDWRYITLGDNGSIFNHCQFYYGGGYADRGTLQLGAHSAAITNSFFAFNTGGNFTNVQGTLDARHALAGTVITGNTFYANSIPIQITTAYDFDASNKFQDASGNLKNTYNGVFVHPAIDGGRVYNSITWSETEVPYVLWSNTIENGGTLTLAANVILKFVKGDYTSTPLYVKDGGTLVQGSGVTFTSIKDDTLLGDTNGDGSATTPAKGDWAGVYYYPSNAPDAWAASPHWADWSNILYATNTSHNP